MSQNLTTIINSLEQVSLRIECGQTYNEASEDLPKLFSDRETIELWTELKKQIYLGKISIQEGIDAFSENLKLKSRLESLIAQKTLTPKYQSRIIAALCLALIAISRFYFPDNFKPTIKICSVSGFLIIAGYFCCNYLIGNFRKSLWYADWIMFLSQIRNYIKWGTTLAPSMKRVLALNLQRYWPKEIQSAIDTIYSCSRNMDRIEDFKFSLGKDHEKNLAQDHIRWIAKLYNKQQPISGMLNKFITRASFNFEQRIHYQADKLNLLLLAPLFIFFLPAFMLLIFAPLLRAIL